MEFDSKDLFEKLRSWVIDELLLSSTGKAMQITDKINNVFVHSDRVEYMQPLADKLNEELKTDFIKAYHLHPSQTFETVFNKLKNGKIK